MHFQLHFVRRCGFANDIFYIEVGRSAVTGDGEFWMAVEDNNIALNMYDVITTAMRNSKSNKDEVGPRQRMRSSSANEASKPISVLQRRHTGQKLHGFSPLGKLQLLGAYFLFYYTYHSPELGCELWVIIRVCHVLSIYRNVIFTCVTRNSLHVYSQCCCHRRITAFRFTRTDVSLAALKVVLFV